MCFQIRLQDDKFPALKITVSSLKDDLNMIIIKYLTSKAPSIRLSLCEITPENGRQHSVFFVTQSEGKSCMSFLFSGEFVSAGFVL